MGLLELLLGDDSSTTEKSAQTVSPSSPSSPADGKTGDGGGDGATFRAKDYGNFPHCPRCFGYALYRKNNVGKYQCETCGMEDINEEVARRIQ